jgi:hypothetical protein
MPRTSISPIPHQLAEEKEVGRLATKRRRWRGIEGSAKKRNKIVPEKMRRWRRITSRV